MAKDNETSFELDVEEIDKTVSKSDKPLRKSPPKKRVHHVAKVSKEENKKESPKKAPEPEPAPDLTQPKVGTLGLDSRPSNTAHVKLPTSHNESIVVQPKKETDNLFGIQVDPVVATVVGAAAAVAGTAAVATGGATSAITAVKAGIIKAKAALGISTKAAAVVGGAAVAGAAILAIEKKMSSYESDIKNAKEEVGDISDQLKKLDQLLDKVKK